MTKVNRLNYIGSKFQLLEWIHQNIQEKTGWESFSDKRIADVFAGTGIVSHYFRTLGANVITNDVELYSYTITYAMTCSIYNENIKSILDDIEVKLSNREYLNEVGYVTEKYSPHENNERMYFTVDNAMRIDFVRKYLEIIKNDLSANDYYFILASIIVSADAVSNVPAVYGCYLKKFKSKAEKVFSIKPIHQETSQNSNIAYNYDVLNETFLKDTTIDLVYLDPPYNERQYSKNYFPLNIIAKTPIELNNNELELKGKTGIPSDCFISPFCKKQNVRQSFENLISKFKTKWIILSYNSESLLKKEDVIDIMSKRGNVDVVEKDYKRFKSYEYNNDKNIKEYLFCLEVIQ